jgi:hypothetical protein
MGRAGQRPPGCRYSAPQQRPARESRPAQRGRGRLWDPLVSGGARQLEPLGKPAFAGRGGAREVVAVMDRGSRLGGRWPGHYRSCARTFRCGRPLSARPRPTPVALLRRIWRASRLLAGMARAGRGKPGPAPAEGWAAGASPAGLPRHFGAPPLFASPLRPPGGKGWRTSQHTCLTANLAYRALVLHLRRPDLYQLCVTGCADARSVLACACTKHAFRLRTVTDRVHAAIPSRGKGRHASSRRTARRAVDRGQVPRQGRAWLTLPGRPFRLAGGEAPSSSARFASRRRAADVSRPRPGCSALATSRKSQSAS